MVNPQEELKSLKERLGNHEPSLLLKAREELITIKKSLEPLFSEQLPASQLVHKLITEKKQLENQLDTKRLASLKEFSKYQEQIKELQNTKLLEITNLKNQTKQLAQEKQVLEQRIKYLRNELSYSSTYEEKKSHILMFFCLILAFSLLTNYKKDT